MLQKAGELLPQCERVLESLAKCAGRQSSRLRCLDLAANIIEKRSRCFLTPDMARRSSQSFAASFCIDDKQFVHSRHYRSCHLVVCGAWIDAAAEAIQLAAGLRGARIGDSIRHRSEGRP